MDTRFPPGKPGPSQASDIPLSTPRVDEASEYFEHARYVNRVVNTALRSSGELQQESQMMLRAVVSHLPVVLWVVDSQGVIRLTEGQGLKAFGLKPGDLVGLRHSEVYSDRPDLVECVNRALRGEEFRIEQHMAPFLFDVYFTPIFGPEGNVTHMVGLTYDITERKKLERELRTAIESRDSFLGIASHELKTPLTSIKLQLQMRKRKLSATAAAQHVALPGEISFIDRLERQFERVAKLVDDMLDTSRIRSNKLVMRAEITNFSEIVREAVDSLAPHFESENRALTAKIYPGLFGNIDGFRLQQVVSNLLINALRHAAPSSVEIELRPQENGFAEFRIMDQGPGIAAQNLERIFERYESGERSRVGLGLGLYISKAIVEAHGGQIHVESSRGKGCTFIVSLPLCASS